jgi:DNA-binding response OmpR family regulator
MRLLVVEDEIQLAAYVKRGLEAEGFAVDIASNGEDGLWMATEIDYDTIILDIMLPKLNGYAVCQRLRQAGRWTPILMLTAKDGDLDEAEALDTGADDYLRKPFALVVLLARLRSLLRRGAMAPADDLTVGDVQLDRGQLACRRRVDGSTIELTRREFAVLEHLARRAPDIVPKQALIDAVWGYDFDGDPNIVEVYVGYLRRKLGKQSVRTVRNVGYQLTGSVS